MLFDASRPKPASEPTPSQNPVENIDSGSDIPWGRGNHTAVFMPDFYQRRKAHRKALQEGPAAVGPASHDNSTNVVLTRGGAPWSSLWQVHVTASETAVIHKDRVNRVAGPAVPWPEHGVCHPLTCVLTLHASPPPDLSQREMPHATPWACLMWKSPLWMTTTCECLDHRGKVHVHALVAHPCPDYRHGLLMLNQAHDA